LLLMASLVGSSIICREAVYSSDLSKNGMATLNAALTGAIAGGITAGFIGLQVDREVFSSSSGTGAPGFALPVFTVLFAIAGAGTGSFLPAIPQAKQAFQESRILYYIPSTLALGVSAKIVYTIWLE
jgi:hypothetical protein